MKQMGLMMILGGTVLVLAGLIFVLMSKFPFAGRMPGDIHIKGENSSFFFPITTCIILSVVLTALANLIFRFFSKH